MMVVQLRLGRRLGEWRHLLSKMTKVTSTDARPVTGEPDPWFHHLLRADGTPYDPAEIDVIQGLLP